MFSTGEPGMVETVLIACVALLVGGLGSMLGIGGGVLLIPLLTGVFGVPIKTAIGASIVSVIATSSAAGAVYVGRGLSHTRLSMVLEIATTLGALAGGITAVLLSPNLLAGLFALVLLYVVYSMRRLPKEEGQSAPTGLLDTGYADPATGRTVTYGVRNLPLGMGASFLAGNVSGLLGIGGGIIKVPIMSLLMGMPLRAAIATSNFMIGVTAATSAARGPWLGAGAPTGSANGVGEETPASTLCSAVTIGVGKAVALGVADGVSEADCIGVGLAVAASVAWTVGRDVGRLVGLGVGIAVAGGASTADWIQ